MTPEPTPERSAAPTSASLAEAMAGLAQREDLPVRDLLCATWTLLVEKGVLGEADIERIVERAKGETTPGRGEMANQALATGHSVTGQSLDDTELVDEASEESFPASDPPGYICQARASVDLAGTAGRVEVEAVAVAPEQHGQGKPGRRARREPVGRPGRHRVLPNQAYATGHSVTGQALDDIEMMDEASEESFPASDPPSYMAGTVRIGEPRRFNGTD